MKVVGALAVFLTVCVFWPNENLSANTLTLQALTAKSSNTDKCKVPTVATKKAPKDLRKELDRLTKLICTSRLEILADRQEWQTRQNRLRTKQLADSILAKKKVVECYRKLGLNYETYRGTIPDRCFTLWTEALPPSTPTYFGGTKRRTWAQAWLSLSTLAKTFPQYIQPQALPILINAYENSKDCVYDENCLPT